jgi:L-asparaginase II
MLAASVALGTPLQSYLEVTHPLQRMIRSVVAQCAGMCPEDVHIGIDGCGAPNFAMPMLNIARSFANIARPDGLPSEIRAALACTRTAMQRDPWLVAGTGEFDTLLMAERPGEIVAKGGAEGLQCVALPRLGLGVAVKFESGRGDGIGSIVIAILMAIGVLPSDVTGPLSRFYRPTIWNHSRVNVGETRHHIEESLSVLARLTSARA